MTDKYPDLDPVIHSRIRLAIMSILISTKDAGFTYLKDTIGTTDGNLSTHLTKLEDAGMISIQKSFKGKKPSTKISITKQGTKAFTKYLDALEKILPKSI
jgi:DNA-binding MarR family transcriptional regulator